MVLLELAELPAQVANPLGSPRVTLIGSVGRIPEPELTAVRMAYLTRFLHSKYWVDFDDLFFYRIGVLDVRIGAQEAEMTSVDRLGLHLLGNGRSRNHGRAQITLSRLGKVPRTVCGGTPFWLALIGRFR